MILTGHALDIGSKVETGSCQLEPLQVLNFNWLFLKLNWFFCNYIKYDILMSIW